MRGRTVAGEAGAPSGAEGGARGDGIAVAVGRSVATEASLGDDLREGRDPPPGTTGASIDRAIDPAVRRRRLARRVGTAVAVTAVLMLGLRWGSAALQPSVSRREVRIGRVDRGELAAVITASGTVVPEIEQVVSMPVEARVLAIHKRPGDPVARGEAILDLDLSAAELEQEKLDQALAQRENLQARTRLDLEARLDDLSSQREVKTLQLGALQAQSQRDRQLQQRGLLARESLAQTELQEAQAAVELRRLAADEQHARAVNRATLAGLALEMATLRHERAEARRQLQLATTRADRPGVVTWTVTEEGATLRKGDVLARIADLRSFRVDATLPDVHAQRLAAGLPVLVHVSEAAAGAPPLEGTVSNVHPTIRDGLLSFAVTLADRSSPRLRSNLRVDVQVVVSRKEQVLRIPRGPFAEAAGVREVFVVRGDRAVRTPVKLGASGSEHLEVLSGRQAGDEAIISDMTESLHLPELLLR